MTLIRLQYGTRIEECDIADFPYPHIISMMFHMVARFGPGLASAAWIMDSAAWRIVKSESVRGNLRTEKDGYPWFMGCPVKITVPLTPPTEKPTRRPLNSPC